MNDGFMYDFRNPANPWALYGNDPDGLFLEVGKVYCGRIVERIECYREPGQGGYVPWFKVFGPADELIATVNAAHVGTVRYARPNPPEKEEMPGA